MIYPQLIICQVIWQQLEGDTTNWVRVVSLAAAPSKAIEATASTPVDPPPEATEEGEDQPVKSPTAPPAAGRSVDVGHIGARAKQGHATQAKQPGHAPPPPSPPTHTRTHSLAPSAVPLPHHLP